MKDIFTAAPRTQICKLEFHHQLITQSFLIYTWEQIISKSEIDCMGFYQTFHFPKKDESGGYLARMQALSEEISLQSP